MNHAWLKPVLLSLQTKLKAGQKPPRLLAPADKTVTGRCLQGQQQARFPLPAGKPGGLSIYFQDFIQLLLQKGSPPPLLVVFIRARHRGGFLAWAAGTHGVQGGCSALDVPRPAGHMPEIPSRERIT